MKQDAQWEAKINKGTTRMQEITSSSPLGKKNKEKKIERKDSKKWPKENPTHAGSTTCH
jgi:hypothetical protein